MKYRLKTRHKKGVTSYQLQERICFLWFNMYNRIEDRNIAEGLLRLFNTGKSF